MHHNQNTPDPPSPLKDILSMMSRKLDTCVGVLVV